jgi:hypothetical protein
MSKDFTVTVNHPQRRLEWLEMFGTTYLHVKSISPEYAEVSGCEEPQLVYYVDLDCLTPRQQQRLIRHLSVKFNLSIDQVKQGLAQQEVPIPATDLVLTINNPYKWLAEHIR